ncbi:MAG: 6-phosphogluconolactonase [Sporomusaceae bacterium]|nr:6-phosphogluconolactonase [Sporomusaceae bacterium]
MLKIYETEAAAAKAAADLFCQTALQAIEKQGCFYVALAGGTTPQKVYELLKEPPYLTTIPWKKVHIFWGDERCVPANSARSNQKMTYDAWLSHVPLPPENIHTINTKEAPEEAALRYETDLKNTFASAPPRFDLIFLGLGADGHTASLFPGCPALKEKQALVRAVFPQTQPEARITFTYPLLNQAKKIVFLATGTAKAAILAEILNTPPHEPPYPAQLVQPTQGEILWLLDQPAAKELSLNTLKN